MITNKESFGYSLAKSAYEYSLIHGDKLARDYLIHNINRCGTLQYWEKTAIAQTYLSLLKGNNQ